MTSEAMNGGERPAARWTALLIPGLLILTAAVGCDDLGLDPDRGVYRVSLESYDPSTDTWIRLSSMPHAATDAGGVALGGYLYVVGGRCFPICYNTAMQRYDPVSDSWQEMAPLPDIAEFKGAAAFDSLIVAVTDQAADSLFVYHVPTDRWSRRGPPPFSGIVTVAAADGSILYVAGGTSADGKGENLMAYDPGSDSWTPLAPMPWETYSVAAAVLEGRLYVMGGFLQTYQNDVRIYDLLSGSWKKGLPLTTARSQARAAAIGGRVYVVGGRDGERTLITLQSYAPGDGIWKRHASMGTRRSGMAVGVIDGRLYVAGGWSYH